MIINNFQILSTSCYVYPWNITRDDPHNWFMNNESSIEYTVFVKKSSPKLNLVWQNHPQVGKITLINQYQRGYR